MEFPEVFFPYGYIFLIIIILTSHVPNQPATMWIANFDLKEKCFWKSDKTAKVQDSVLNGFNKVKIYNNVELKSMDIYINLLMQWVLNCSFGTIFLLQ